ncbi:MAG: acyl-ACP--UDP-N-acetylglucosamine O-acyltransferase [Trueperaceae bacterium]|nr:MAG: acyl-ACP--UDP-N-acetylglucosamine O-acyltransferase [Trueperaceae bacterium]
MAPRVHPRADVDPSAELGEGVTVEAGAVVEAGVRIGPRSVVRVGTVLHAGTQVGADARLGPYAVVGGEPMDARYRGEPTRVVLADGVVLREFVSVHRSTGEATQTSIGTDTLVMSGAHVSHNCVVGARCVLTTLVQLGGHAEVGDDAVLGANAMVHQFCRVGRGAMLGAASGTNQDVLPFLMARGSPARHFRLNRVGLLRRETPAETYAALEAAVRALRRRDTERFADLAREHPAVAELQGFVASSRRGVARFQGA